MMNIFDAVLLIMIFILLSYIVGRLILHNCNKNNDFCDYVVTGGLVLQLVIPTVLFVVSAVVYPESW